MKKLITFLLPCLLCFPWFASAAEWQPLFDSKSLGCWSAKDGVLTGVEDAEKLGSNLETVKEFKDFVLEAEAKVAALLKPGDWNKFRIELRGKKITVWFNGEKVIEHEQDKFTEAGPIGLQVHKETPGMKVEYRNLRVMEL